ncbi:uncharacterized protein F5891DRAFT_995315 [Suillus fuscotomentosus]|uniref:Secreted protein n=1 Tax=Suillus fuscotomentosus TaxID=1912939 RepID=A0AAD4EME1_9AGAM|nr:uncharacterized protein F5891DRAFT_995315 [Suillus fuscotomentosus]KAG1908858.1 hypothetical protein F5891DRAFT_995315 [Suillus fuscotomentosus]
MLGFQKLLCYVTLWQAGAVPSASFSPCCACPAPPARQIPDPTPSRSFVFQYDNTIRLYSPPFTLFAVFLYLLPIHH